MKIAEEKSKSSFRTFLYKYILVEYNEEEKKNLPKEIFLVAGLVFVFSCILIFLNIQKIEYSSVLNFIYVMVFVCCISFYKKKKNLSINREASIFNLILKIAFYVFLFFSFYLISQLF